LKVMVDLQETSIRKNMLAITVLLQKLCNEDRIMWSKSLMNVPYMACKTAEMKIIQLQRKESVKKGLSIQTAADESQTQGLLIIKPQQYTGVIQIKNRDQMG